MNATSTLNRLCKTGYSQFISSIFWLLPLLAQAQFTQQGNKLLVTGAVGTPVQGYGVAVSADGNTAIVGGIGDNSNVGATWVFTRSGTGAWSQQGSKLVGTGGSTGAISQGRSVALSADGNTALVGGENNNNREGAAWVFTRTGNTWTQQGAKLVGTGAIGAANQGCAVALSSDGNTALVAGRADNDGMGAVWVFTRTGSTWSQQGAKLVGTGSIGTPVNQGESIALSGDGNTAMIGGQYDDIDKGAVWVFTRTGSTWSQQGNKLRGTGSVGDYPRQGKSVALSSDGNTALLGCAQDNYDTGAVWVFTRTGSTWSQQGSKLLGTGKVGLTVYQGYSVSLSADGNKALIGAPADNYNIGATWVFTRTGSTWSQEGIKLVGTGGVGISSQGYVVALSGDGNTAVVGAPDDNRPTGTMWVFATPAALPVTLRYFNGRMTKAGALLGWQTSSETNNAYFAIERSRDRNAGPGLSFEGIGTVPGGVPSGQVPVGNSGTSLTYSFTDSQPLPGVNYYRLIQVDRDGTRTPSKVIALSKEGQQTVLYPNPVGTSGEAVLEPALAYTRYELTDVLGRVRMQASEPGTLSSLSVGTLPAGVYVLRVQTEGGGQQVFRVVR